jgi:hypothetical protein
MQDYIEDKRTEVESNIAFINPRNESDQRNDINIIVALLKECIQKKEGISKASRLIMYQLYGNQLIGFSTSMWLYYFFAARAATATFEQLILLITSLILLFCLSLWVVVKNIIKDSWISVSIRKKFAFFFYVMFSVFFVSFISILQSSVYSSFPIIIMFAIDLVLIKRFQNLTSETKIINRNLEKIIRMASQIREHVDIGFGTKAELEVRLTIAEDVLENPRLFF